MSAIPMHKEDFGLLIEGGFVAVKQGNRNAARRLFEAAHRLRPEHSAPKLGFGYIALNELNLPLARQTFEAILNEEPNNAMAKVLLGFSFMMDRFMVVAGKRKGAPLPPQETTNASVAKGHTLIEQALQQSQDPAVHRLGKAAMELAQKVGSYLETPMKH